jgi:hypothetical protein
MSRSLKSRSNDIFNPLEKGAGKNGLRRSPINDDLSSGNTWGTLKKQPFHPTRLAGCAKEVLPL